METSIITKIITMKYARVGWCLRNAQIHTRSNSLNEPSIGEWKIDNFILIEQSNGYENESETDICFIVLQTWKFKSN